MYLNRSIFALSLLTLLCSTPSLSSAKEHKPANLKPNYAPETMYRASGSTLKLEKTKLSDRQIMNLAIGTFPLFVDLGKKYFAGFRGSNEATPKQSCTNTSFTLHSISLDTYLKKNQITTKQWEQAYPGGAINRLVTLVKTNCKIPFFREFILDSSKQAIESGSEYGSIIINHSNVFFMGEKPVPIILPQSIQLPE